MRKIHLKTKTAADTIQLGKELGSLLQSGDILALQGTLAAGKTQLTKGIAQGLNISEAITSPTFTIISEYYGRLPLYHMDVYRLGSAEEFLDIGVEELLYGSGVCIIEWSEKVMSELPAHTIIIQITAQEDSSRTITIENWPYSSAGLEYYKELQ
ncbi:tRNA (adenosine(37)-N6)-threonylcarbamoyltransferase complex ATPase subunit type 1 TsaE [Treponema phagedenis]|uniref:tRNA (adenosine(37)-N6)-threonylcarbamoyltransferase complex ATPase subunit type 1 TsaE n=1 Tax=Treponema phagedenis TaxID=162 RepID=UPI003CC7FA27